MAAVVVADALAQTPVARRCNRATRSTGARRAARPGPSAGHRASRSPRSGRPCDPADSAASAAATPPRPPPTTRISTRRSRMRRCYGGIDIGGERWRALGSADGRYDGEQRGGWVRYAPALYLVLALAMVALVLPERAPSAAAATELDAELAPDAPPDDQDAIVSALNRGTSGTAGAGAGEAEPAQPTGLRAPPVHRRRSRRVRCRGSVPGATATRPARSSPSTRRRAREPSSVTTAARPPRG